jgi:RNA polymerase sigma-70 factor (ECF subfamily)
MERNAAVLPNELALAAAAPTEPAAFGMLYDHYFPKVYRYIRYRVGDPATADDLTAQVFERAFTKIKSYRPDLAPFATWLFAITRHAVINASRHRRPHVALGSQPEQPNLAPPLEEYVIADEEKNRLLAAVADLPERERELIALKFGAGLTNREIAKLTGMKDGNVGVILFRTLRKLRNVLEAKEGDRA